uniref:Bacteriophage head to tail connecting protein n=1 Tax=Candidatus Kentrum sp. UNK TaxID=2126344 RepID=A0A451ARG7_9GAMM|nr:MAG: Bacteriophage head to tail connecting protein [Candidatus Kentron sp. UNK]VFK68623.1 MAG: Bacteriophage head to tail connecting protein [Candidatus Kentron sp. UNK]
MMDKRAAKILDLYENLATDRQTIAPILEEIRNFIMPLRDSVTAGQRPMGAAVSTHRRDSTACYAQDLLSTAIAGALMPDGAPDMKLIPREPALEEDLPTLTWLEDASRRIEQDLAGIHGNFQEEAMAAITDAIGYGTTALFTEGLPPNPLGNFGGFRFDTWEPRRYVFTEGNAGVDTVYRELKLTARQALEKLEKKPGFLGLGERMEKALASDKPADIRREFSFIQAIEPNPDPESGKTFAARFPISSTYVCKEDKRCVLEGGYREMPVSVARWSKLSDDKGWGRGLGWLALPHQKALNRTEEIAMRSFTKDLAPPLVTPHRGIVGQVNTAPNALLHLDTHRAGNMRPYYLPSAINWQGKELMESKHKEIIYRIYLVDQLRLDEKTGRTATEVEYRRSIMLRLLGPVLARFVPELFNHILLRVFAMKLRAGAFPPLPPALTENATRQNGELDIEVEYQGPIAQATRMQEPVAIQNTLEMGAAIAQATGDASVLDNLDADNAFTTAALRLGAPASLLRDPKAVSEIRDARARREAEQGALLEAEQVANIQKTAKEAGAA